MDKKVFISILFSTSLLVSCASTKKSIWSGIGIGAVSGGAICSGVSHKNRQKGAIVGALSGALIGGIASYYIDQGLSSRDEEVRRKTLFNLDKFNVSAPMNGIDGNYHGLTMPAVESEWVPTKVEGKKLVEGHKIWIITEDAQWIPGNEIKAKSKRRKKKSEK